MRKFAIACLISIACLGATTLTGKLNLPSGVGANGTLSLMLSQQAALSTGTGVGNYNCSGPLQVIPNVAVNISIVSGVVTGSPTVYGNDCLLPSGTYYSIVFSDLQGNRVFSDLWSITGATEDIGTIVSTTITGTTTFLGQNGVILTSPAGAQSQTITQQPSTALNINYLDVTGTFTGPGGISCTGTGCVFGAPLAAPDGLTAAGPTSITIGGGNIYGRVYSGGDANCTGIADGWFGFRADTNQLQVCLSGQMYQSALTLP